MKNKINRSVYLDMLQSTAEACINRSLDRKRDLKIVKDEPRRVISLVNDSENK